MELNTTNNVSLSESDEGQNIFLVAKSNIMYKIGKFWFLKNIFIKGINFDCKSWQELDA